MPTVAKLTNRARGLQTELLAEHRRADQHRGGAIDHAGRIARGVDVVQPFTCG